MSNQAEIEEYFLHKRVELKSSFLTFCQYFHQLLYNRPFIISRPVGRESHFITCSRELTKLGDLDNMFLYLKLPPGYGKSTMCVFWVAWMLAKYPSAEFIYTSYSIIVASKHTETIKMILELKEYRDIFGISIRRDASAKKYFKTNFNGVVYAAGTQGTITGFNAGYAGSDEFSGALIIDDAHKPDEVYTESTRENVIKCFNETLTTRLRSDKVPILFIAQPLHEADLAAYVCDKRDGRDWKVVAMPSFDEHDNPLYPEAFPYEMLCNIRDYNPVVWSAQHMLTPTPAGGSLFKPEYFPVLDEEPEMLVTFITCDTAETDKTYNDFTVFSFWGLYYLENNGRKSDTICLHLIDCEDFHAEPKDLEGRF